MLKKELEKNFVMYQFTPEESHALGINIFALINGLEALVIDAGYEEQMQQVVKDLALNDIKIKHVIPSHYHSDHIYGIKQVNNPVVYGNKDAENTIEIEGYSKEFLPNTILKDKDTFMYGGFKLEFIEAPGHSNCSLLIHINDTYLHVGDLYMTLNSGIDVLPYLAWSGVQNHINSLKKVNDYCYQCLLLSHGKLLKDKQEISEGIQNRVAYLNELLKSNNGCTAKEAVKNCTKEFAKMSWRKYVK